MANLKQKIWKGTLAAGIIGLFTCGPMGQYSEKKAEEFISKYDSIKAESKINQTITYRSIAIASLALAFPSGIAVYYYNHPKYLPKTKKKKKKKK